MNLFTSILTLVLTLAPKVILGIETVIGDAQSGTTKRKMAQDALNAAASAAASALPAGSDNAVYATAAAGAVSSIINDADTITGIVNATRASGAYQVATAKAKAAQVSTKSEEAPKEA